MACGWPTPSQPRPPWRGEAPGTDTTGIPSLSVTAEPSTTTTTEQATLAPTDTPTAAAPTAVPANLNPLTGLAVADQTLLNRRPIVVKVQNVPRSSRPAWGLSLADLVFEYYTEEGATRFAAIFYSNDAKMVGPIRSGRFIDADIVRAYKAMFVFGSAYQAEWDRFVNSDFASQLVVEGDNTPLFRFEPNGQNYLMVNTADITAFAAKRGLGGQQNLNGMTFTTVAPAGGQPGTQTYIRYSGVIYNRWDFYPALGKYLRFSDNADDFNNNKPVYLKATDRLTGQPIASDNVVVLLVSHELYSDGIYDILLSGSGDAYAFRDGLSYKVRWQRDDTGVVTLINTDGTPFPFKPGNTWFEVIGSTSRVQQIAEGYRFQHMAP